METHNIYLKVVEIANIFVLKRAHLTISVLQDFDPSVEEFAETVRSIAEMIHALSSDFSDSNMAINAFQCSLDLQALAKAVLSEDQESVDRALDSLESYVNGPY